MKNTVCNTRHIRLASCELACCGVWLSGDFTYSGPLQPTRMLILSIKSVGPSLSDRMEVFQEDYDILNPVFL